MSLTAGEPASWHIGFASAGVGPISDSRLAPRGTGPRGFPSAGYLPPRGDEGAASGYFRGLGRRAPTFVGG